MVRIGRELWDAAKKAERGYDGQGPETPLAILARPENSAARKTLAVALAEAGAEKIATGRNGRVSFCMPAGRVLFLTRVAGLNRVDLAAAPQRRLPGKPLWWAGLALLLLLACGAGAVHWGPREWRPQWVQNLAAWWSDDGEGVIRRPKPKPRPQLPREDDGVPRREKPKPTRPGEVEKRNKPKPAQPGQGQEDAVISLYHRGLVFYHAGDKAQAVKLWRAALEKDPNLLGVRRNLGWALYEMGDKAAAIRQFELILAGHPGDEEARAAMLIIERDGQRGDHSRVRPGDGP